MTPATVNSTRGVVAANLRALKSYVHKSDYRGFPYARQRRGIHATPSRPTCAGRGRRAKFPTCKIE